MSDLPETVLQFGSGKFLRGFADLFIDQANREGQRVGRVVAVQTTGDRRADLLNQQGGRYHVLVRGFSGGTLINQVEEVTSIGRALVAARQWDEVLNVARSPALRFIISNTAEAGYATHPDDRPGDAPPRSFPAKLLRVLHARHAAGRPGVTVLPCELFEGNADRLLRLLFGLAGEWGLPERFREWLSGECVWRNALVDRIVALPAAAPPGLEGDGLLTTTEPFALWAIETRAGAMPLFRHPAIQEVPDVRPFFLRKVRILNAAHTALATRAVAQGVATVRAALEVPAIADWLNRLLFDEILPVVTGRVEAPEAFAHQTLERFRNPFIEHKIADILTYHAEKVQIRLVPTRDEFVARFGRRPPLLEEAIAAPVPAG